MIIYFILEPKAKSCKDENLSSASASNIYGLPTQYTDVPELKLLLSIRGSCIL